MEPTALEVCTVAVTGHLPATGQLPRTGGSTPVWMVLAAVVVLLVGAALVTWDRRARRGEAGPRLPGATLFIVIVAAAAVLLPMAGTAFAAAAQVDYGRGCTLIEVTDVETSEAPVSMLPGDTAVVLTATVVNRFDGPITLTGTAVLATGVVATATATVGDGTGPVSLNSGSSTRAAITIALPAWVSDAAVQGTTMDPVLTLTAAQQ